ncbi:MAG: sn-glycerol-3-phosphate-binding periplasmic protein UgpB [Phycisphaerae bacterium]|nr:sn-glycerol-3-phosphate-binding periplasmic protein UgpB [Phycisphaerae bacterium]
MNIRSWLLALVLIAPAALLLAFGPRGRVEIPDNRRVIRYWEKWTGVEGRAITDLVDRFNNTVGAQRGLFVEYNAVSNIEQRLLIATAGGDPPDLAGLIDSRVPQYAAQNALLPLDDLVRDAAIDLELLKPIWLELGRYDGKLYALPSTPFTIALYYNRTLFRQAGLDPDRPPQTIAELDQAVERLTRRDEQGKITQLGFTMSPAMLGWWSWVWPNFFDGRLWDGQRYALDSSAGVAAAEWIWQMRERLGRQAALDFEAAAGPIESAENPFLSGRLAMVFQGPWMANWIRNYAPSLDYAVAPFPSSTTGRRHVFASADVFVIPAGAKHPRDAMVFLAWMQRPDVLEELCKRHGKVSPFRTPRSAFFDGHPNPFVRVFDEIASSPDAFGFPGMPMWAQVEAELLNLMQTLLRGNRSPEQAIRYTQQRIDLIVNEYQHMAAKRRGEQ